MQHYVLEISKYIITLFMALYTYECFAVFRFDNEERRRGIYIRQNIFMFCFHFMCYLDICIKTNKIEYLFFFAFQQIALFATITLYSMIYPRSNKLIVNNMCMLLSVGFVILTRLSFEKSVKQFLIVVLSIVIAMIIPQIIRKLMILKQITWIYAGIGIVTLGIVLVMGAVTNGSKLSFSLWGVTFQPSEFIKIVYVFFVAGILKEAEDFKTIVVSAIAAGIHVIILVLSRDLGSALIFFVTYVMMLYIATKKPVYLLVAAGCAAIASVVAYHMFSHIQVRVQAWKDPWSVIDDAGYQIAQSLFAISSGGMFGLGIYGGTPRDIPYVETDFVFSAIAEELGLLFCICLIMLYISCFIMFMNIAMRVKDKFYQMVAFGLGVTYGFQIFLTVGGGTKFIPLTGVTLPLISYGGSSVMATLIMFAVIEGIYCIRQVGGKSVVRKKMGTQQERKTETQR
ncbi:MAG: FtsW/RodA/SpoVE family cell cycle protein [Lachnospiraceae bacterium]|nr:FtsW/RodA/SpoVE family cell cycle protein [Lachnospiraceae bacterium]